MRDILQALANGEITTQEAQRRLNLHAIQEVGDLANLDLGRMVRTGKPEIVRCAGKSVEQAVELALPFLDEPGVVALSSATADHEAAIQAARPDAAMRFEPSAGILIARNPDTPADAVDRRDVGRGNHTAFRRWHLGPASAFPRLTGSR